MLNLTKPNERLVGKPQSPIALLKRLRRDGSFQVSFILAGVNVSNFQNRNRGGEQ